MANVCIICVWSSGTSASPNDWPELWTGRQIPGVGIQGQQVQQQAQRQMDQAGRDLRRKPNRRAEVAEEVLQVEEATVVMG